MKFVIFIVLFLVCVSCVVNDISIVTPKDINELVMVTNINYIHYFVENDSIVSSNKKELAFNYFVKSNLIYLMPRRITLFEDSQKYSTKNKYKANEIIALYNPNLTNDLIRYELFFKFSGLEVEEDVYKQRKLDFKSGKLKPYKLNPDFNKMLLQNIRDTRNLEKQNQQYQNDTLITSDIILKNALNTGTSISCMIELKDRKNNVILKTFSDKFDKISATDTIKIKKIIKYLIERMDFE